MNMPEELTEKYKDDAKQHAEFLCENVFTPAFEMAFVHGAKHMYEEKIKTLNFITKDHIIKELLDALFVLDQHGVSSFNEFILKVTDPLLKKYNYQHPDTKEQYFELIKKFTGKKD